MFVERGSATDVDRARVALVRTSAPAGVHRIGRPRHHLRDRDVRRGNPIDDLADRPPRRRLGPHRGDRASRRRRRHCPGERSPNLGRRHRSRPRRRDGSIRAGGPRSRPRPSGPWRRRRRSDLHRSGSPHRRRSPWRAAPRQRPPARTRPGVLPPVLVEGDQVHTVDALRLNQLEFLFERGEQLRRSPDGPHGPGGRRRSQPPNARRAGRRRLGPAGRPPDDPVHTVEHAHRGRDSGVVGQSITAVVQDVHGASGSGDLEKRYRGITTVGFPPWGCDSYTARSTPSSPSTAHGPTPETRNCSSGRTRPWPTSTAVSSSTMADSRC